MLSAEDSQIIGKKRKRSTEEEVTEDTTPTKKLKSSNTNSVSSIDEILDIFFELRKGKYLRIKKIIEGCRKIAEQRNIESIYKLNLPNISNCLVEKWESGKLERSDKRIFEYCLPKVPHSYPVGFRRKSDNRSYKIKKKVSKTTDNDFTEKEDGLTERSTNEDVEITKKRMRVEARKKKSKMKKRDEEKRNVQNMNDIDCQLEKLENKKKIAKMKYELKLKKFNIKTEKLQRLKIQEQLKDLKKKI